MKDGDIFRWSYTEKALKAKNHGRNGGTTYWCMSQIGIWREDRQALVHTYWSGADDRWFGVEDINTILILKFVANINELDQINNKGYFNNYDSSDCIDISHSNMMRGGLYIKKGAKPSIEKKCRVFEAHIEHHMNKAEYHTKEVAYLKKQLSELTVDSYAPYNTDVHVE